MKNYKSIIALVAVGMACTAVESQAQLVTGYVWQGTSWDPSATGIVPSTAPSTSTAIGTLSGSGSLNFYSANPAHPDTQPDEYYTPSTFLGTGGYTYTAITPGSGNFNLNDTLFEFIGQTLMTSGKTYTIDGDDGQILKINGTTVFSSPNPQSDYGPNSFVWTGATGIYSFQLLYGEVDGAPATLNTSLTVVPEPGTIVAGALILLPFGVSTLRIMRKNKVA